MAFSVMFHHLKGGEHINGQGAISVDELNLIIKFLDREFNLIGAQDYYTKTVNKKLCEDDVALSFDDGLKCQYDLALPELNRWGIDAFFFIYSGIFANEGTDLEIYRDFRSRKFTNFNSFFCKFWLEITKKFGSKICDNFKKKARSFLNEHTLYTVEDREFRYVRDVVLTSNQYKEIMNNMMIKEGYDVKTHSNKLFITKQNISNLCKQGHIVGLHSHCHPTMMNKLSFEKQKNEYNRNKHELETVINSEIRTMSHPCGRYNQDTLRILKGLGISLGFRSSMADVQGRTNLGLPRNDHMNILRQIKR